MSRKYILRKGIFSVILFLYLITYCVNVYAREDKDALISIGKGLTELGSICASANKISEVTVVEYTSNDGLLSFSNSNYKELDPDTKKKFMSELLTGIRNSELTPQFKNKSYNFIEKQDSSIGYTVKYLKNNADADLVGAISFISPISGVYGVLIAFICILAFLFTGVSLVIDVVWTSIPLVQIILPVRKGNKRPLLVSQEAFAAYNECVMDSGKDPALTFLKRRVPTIVVLSISLGYIIAGCLFNLLIWFVENFKIA